MIFIHLLLISFYNLYVVSSDDVLGCNGFVKSDLNIDLSKVYVKLFTKQGNLKDQTECAPNGYYFLPIYDSGEYIIKVSTPSGWSFDPSQVAISVDGVNDPCSLGKDINFVFTGFAISGQVVSEGFEIGPKGVTVQLFDTSNPSNIPELITTLVTEKGGSFHISPVKPGNYIVKASHPRWKLSKSEATVLVKESNGEVAKGTLSVAGYDVSGSVTSDNQPISGVSFLLFAKTKVKVEDCDVTPLEGVSTEGWLCHITSNSKGVFTFPRLPPRAYSLVPHYKGAGAKFNILPTKLDFTLSHESLTLPTVFQVQGFTVVGRVLWSQGGKPMEKVNVFLKGSHITTTDSQGIYTLDGMRASTYRLQFKADGVLFNDGDVKVSGTQLADILPSRYKISGKLVIPELGKSGSHPVQRHVHIKGPGEVTQQVPVDSQGEYSAYLAPGVYSLSVLSLDTDKTSSLQFSPAEKKVEVQDSTIGQLDFFQLKSTVKGKIICMKTPCPAIIVKLKPTGSGSTLQTVAKDGSYTFTDILPGDYDLFVEASVTWCWEKEMVSISISSENTVAPTFTQSGYVLSIVSSHTTKVVYKSDVGDSEGEILCGVGGMLACVPTAHPYTLTPIGCHGYKEKTYKWSAGSPPVKLLALTHGYTFSIVIPKGAVHPQVSTSRLQEQTQQPSQLTAVKVLEEKGSEKLIYTVQLAEGDKLDISPSSSLLLFSPKTVQISGDNDCTDSTVQPLFSAELGHTLKGRVLSGNSTGLGGVLVSVYDELGSIVAKLETSQEGYYSSPPIRKLPSYNIKAVKEGYVLTGPNASGNFYAHKLAEIIVKVADKADDKPLQGVLLSLSGGERYRRNAHSGEDGVLTFNSLSPAQYFLRPMMKEYKFTPASRTITVAEGQTQIVELKGVRVAYSAFGVVSSLNGDGEPGIVVEAVGSGHCNLYQEEATSGPNGHFRIRGLQSGCEYNVKVKEGAEVNQHIYKSSPEKILVKVDNDDVKDLQLYAFRSLGKTDIIVYVTVDRPEDMKTLKVKVTREDLPDHTVSSARLSDYRPTSGYSLSGAIVALPSVPSDGSLYLVSLETNLARATHDYALRSVRIVADAPLRIARLNFAPTLKQRDTEPTSSSYLALPLVLIAFLALYYRSTLATLISSLPFDESNQTYQDKKKAKLRKVQ